MVNVLSPRGKHRCRFGLQHQAHQVKKMTALLHKCAAGVDIESIPVVHLYQEWKPMLANCQHAEIAQHTAARICKQLHCWRHEPILQTHPHHTPRLLRLVLECKQFFAILGGSTQRLFNQQVSTTVQ